LTIVKIVPMPIIKKTTKTREVIKTKIYLKKKNIQCNYKCKTT